ncbi:MAG: thiamine pyrophosphate-dependent dehydrogenase E1 component subunit alpha [Acidobacteria bacterium]|nr:thiamine pyrophosphate-dependent dehydrogenase E1 component subunit alpha [Acidobacteriota bacterium]
MDLSKKWPLTREQLHELYYFMKLTRAVEDQMVKLIRQNKMVSGLYSSLGQEATAVGTTYALSKEDWFAPMIRNIGSQLTRGLRPQHIFTQHMARDTSMTRGKDGTSHCGDLEHFRMIAPISMLGDLIPVMTGVAMGSRYLGHKSVAMTWIGDGGSSTGAFHEGMNLAASQKAPFVLVIENNQWAYSTPVKNQVPLKNLADRAKAYGIESYIVDGNDVVAVYQTTKDAVEKARAGQGPILIESKTHRMKGHAQHDAQEYVPKEMMEFWKKRDPIALFEKYLTQNKLWNERDKPKIEERIAGEIREDLEFAESSPFPPPELAEEGVYCDGCHEIKPKWKRPIAEVTPPKSSVRPVWQVDGFGAAEMEPPNASQANASGNGAKPTPTAARVAKSNTPVRGTARAKGKR